MSVANIVFGELAKLMSARHGRTAISMDDLLVEDLGIDSMTFSQLTVALEEALGVNDFPMQQWIDDCVDLGKPLSVGELVRTCEDLRDRAVAG